PAEMRTGEALEVRNFRVAGDLRADVLVRALVSLGVAHRILGLDASPASIDLAERLAREAGLAERVQYRVVDVDRLSLEHGAHDAVIAKMSLHHFERLEALLDEIAASLKPGGVFMFNEFIGPSRFQWTDVQLDHMNRLLQTLPRSIRGRTAVARIRRPLVEDVIAQDPSESIRSAEIMPLVRERFELIEERPYGGTLLHILLEQLLPVIDWRREEDLAYLRLIMAYERALIEGGVLPSDFVYAVGVARAGS
ncbi:MAG: class I SAM-dependent methyltransferase, partial [Acidobacteriota bacterium]